MDLSDLAGPGDHPEGLFHGTAWYYARFRPAYPDALFDYLISKFELGDKSNLLDLGCGTGQMAIPLARHFRQVFAMDPDPDMLTEGRVSATEKDIENIQWIQASSDHLESIGPDLTDLQLVVMASSFHWMDRKDVLGRLNSMLDHGGGIAITGYPSLWNAKGDWQAAVRSVIQRHVGTERRAGSGHFKEPSARHEAIISQSAFRRQERVLFQVARTWTIEQIVGHLFSTSFCSPHVLGERRTAFEQDLRRTLRGLRGDELFDESSDLEVITAYK